MQICMKQDEDFMLLFDIPLFEVLFVSIGESMSKLNAFNPLQ